MTGDIIALSNSRAENAQAICGDNRDAIRAIIRPHSATETNIALLQKRGKVSFLVNLTPFSPLPFFVSAAVGSRRTGHPFPPRQFAEAMSRKTNMLFLITLINEETSSSAGESCGDSSRWAFLFENDEKKMCPVTYFFLLFM